MKITSINPDPLNHSSSNDCSPPQGPDLLPKQPSYSSRPARRKNKYSGSAGVRPAGRKSRPETPLLRWKFEDGRRENDGVEKASSEVGRKVKDRSSARKLAAALWRMQLPEGATHGGDKSGVDNVAVTFHGHRSCNVHISPNKELVQSPHSVSGQKNGLLNKVGSSLQFSNSAMEGATKWDPIVWKAASDEKRTYHHPKHVNKQGGVASALSFLEAELEQARARIHDLETDRRSSKKKLEHFLRKLSEERAAWRSREHDKIRAIIDDMQSDLNRERKNRQRLEIVNSKLVNELADAKLSAKCYMQEYEKERKARVLIEEVCDELAKEIGEDKAEIEELKKESMGLREEVEDERKMLQMAEVWREERVQMKLVDAKIMLEDKYAQMNRLIDDIESFLNSRVAETGLEEIRNAELLRQAAASMNIQDIREFTYEPPNPDDIFAVFEDVNCCEPNERQIEPCFAQSPASHSSKVHILSPEANRCKQDEAIGCKQDDIHRYSNGYVNNSGELEEGSEWETVSHLEDQGSSYSPEASDPSIIRSRQDSNISRGGSEWDGNRGEGTPITEITEVCSVQNRQLKKVSSISRLWRSFPANAENYKIISLDEVNGRVSNGVIHYPDYHPGKGGLIHPDLAGQWSSPDLGNPHANRGMKGCIEWPRSAQKNSLKSKLLEARMENQKIQLRQVLKQKI